MLKFRQISIPNLCTLTIYTTGTKGTLTFVFPMSHQVGLGRVTPHSMPVAQRVAAHRVSAVVTADDVVARKKLTATMSHVHDIIQHYSSTYDFFVYLPISAMY